MLLEELECLSKEIGKADLQEKSSGKVYSFIKSLIITLFLLIFESKVTISPIDFDPFHKKVLGEMSSAHIVHHEPGTKQGICCL